MAGKLAQLLGVEEPFGVKLMRQECEAKQASPACRGTGGGECDAGVTRSPGCAPTAPTSMPQELFDVREARLVCTTIPSTSGGVCEQEVVVYGNTYASPLLLPRCAPCFANAATQAALRCAALHCTALHCTALHTNKEQPPLLHRACGTRAAMEVQQP
jgi:hypothetical protein